jgi:hypothetical protein
MEFDCGRTRYQRRKWRLYWHRWFAWRPVRVGPRTCLWLQHVERKWVCWKNDISDPLQYCVYRPIGSTWDAEWNGPYFDKNYRASAPTGASHD